MGERAGLEAVTEHGDRVALQRLAHEDPHHVAVWITDVLVGAVHVVWPEDDVRQAEHLAGCGKVLLHTELGYAVGVFGLKPHRLGERWGLAAVDSHAGGEGETLYAILDSDVDESGGRQPVVLDVVLPHPE